MKTTAPLLFLAFGLFVCVQPAPASTPGSDNANAVAYNDDWQTNDNGGTGFNPWTLTPTLSGNGAAGFFIGNSTALSTTPGANINVNSRSFGMYAEASGNGSDSAFGDAYRSFAGGGLAVGQTFSLDLAVNYRNGFKGIDLRSGNTTLFNLNIGGDDYTANGTSISSNYSDNTAFHLTFTQSSTTGGEWLITRSGEYTDSDSGTYSGVADTVHLYIGNTQTGVNNNLFANNLAIAPEPAVWAWLAIGGVGALILGQRRKARA